MSGYVDALVPLLRPRPVLVVITGAGASFDSVAEAPDGYSPDRPPLTQGLFQPDFLRRFLAKDLGAARSLIASLSIDPKGADLERLLDREFRASEDNPSLRRSFMALRFYLRDAIGHCQVEWPRQVGGATNYAWLVREVEHWRSQASGYVAWVTVNYDTLLEDALLDLHAGLDLGTGGITDPTLTGYLSQRDWCLIHLHGSTRWSRGVDPKPRSSERTGSREDVINDWDPTTDPPTDHTVYQRSESVADDARTRVPAIAAPLASKATFECPPSHVSHLKTVLTQSDFLMTIGWRAQESHVRPLLQKELGNPPDVLVVSRSPDSARAIADSMEKLLLPVGSNPMRFDAAPVNGFSGLRRQGALRSLLAKSVLRSGSRRQASWVP